jgi:zinc protease
MQATVRPLLTALALCCAVAAQTLLAPSAKAQKALPDTAVPAAEKTSQGKTMDIQEVTSPGGIKAWLVESHANPLISIRFAFFGGAAQDAPGKDGQAYFVTSMMDEGAGDLDSTAFQERAEDLAMKLDFDASRDVMLGSLQTLTANKDEVFELARLAMTEPRFDEIATARVKAQILAGLKYDENDPATVASIAWDRAAFRDHPYGRPVKGSLETIGAITSEDLHDYVRRVFAQDRLVVAAVGDITPEELGKALDTLFGGLPKKADLREVEEATPPLGPAREVIQMDVTQSVAQFGFRGIARQDDDFIPAYILNYIIGGGGFSSRLMEEVREKRGLAYSVTSNLYPYHYGSVFVGNVATKNEAVGQSLKVIQDELEDVAENGLTEDQLDAAKSYLTGAYALRFESSSSIANQLLWIQIEDLGIDYVEKRNALIEAVTLEDVKRVAARLLAPDQLITTIVGQPVEEPVPVGAPG